MNDNESQEDAMQRASQKTAMYVDMNGVGAWFGVPGKTVARWRTRYAKDHPCPEPDAWIGRTPGWKPASEAAWREWEAGRPGQGAGGGRPPKGS